MSPRGKKSRQRLRAAVIFAVGVYLIMFLRLHHANSSLLHQQQQEQEQNLAPTQRAKDEILEDTYHANVASNKTKVKQFTYRRDVVVPSTAEQRIKAEEVQQQLSEKYIVNASSPDPSFYKIPSDGTNLWDANEGLPDWIKSYMNWHKEKIKTLTPDTWQSERFFIMQCIAGIDDHHCGGTGK